MAVKEYLETVNNGMIALSGSEGMKRDGYKYVSMYDFVLREGIEFKEVMPAWNCSHRGAMKECYMNAFNLAMQDSDMIYCEGMACGIIPVFHAWCVDIKGRVYDFTWKDGHEYLGIPFATYFVMKTIFKREYYGMIDDWQNKWPLLKNFPKKAKAKLKIG